MKRKILSIFSAMCMAVSLTGCGDSRGIPKETAISTESTGEISIETNTENEVSFEELNHININGTEVSLPFSIDELGEKYTIEEEYGFNKTYSTLYYGNQCLAIIKLDGENNIISMAFDSNDFEQSTVKIHSVSFDDSFSEIINMFGTPSKKEELALSYEYDKGCVYIGSEDGSLGCNYLKISLNEDLENEYI